MEDDQGVVEYIRSYEEKPFKGPNSAAAAKNGTIYFTDSGPLGETTMQNPKGSVFCVIDEFVQPLAYQCLAHPSGIALSPNDDAIYVCETMQNRLLRFVQKPYGVYHCSVFYTFSGTLGPTGVAVDKKGFIYVSHFDFADLTKTEEGPGTGIITVLSPTGKMYHELKVTGSEITHLSFDPDKKFLYLSERSTKSIYRIQCSN
jgi:sugar lactone lactonase YvrE